MLIIAFVYSTLFNYVYFITSRAHFRRSVDIFFFEDNADGSQAPHVAAQKRQRRYTESGALLNWVPDLS